MDQYINRIINADCMDILRALPDKCADVIFTDPPYASNFAGMGICKQRPNYKKISAYGSDDNIDYSEWFDLVCSKCKTINFFSFCDKATKFQFMQMAQSHGYSYREIPFCKTSPVPFAHNQWLNDVEWGIHIFKNGIRDGDYRTKRGWFTVDNMSEPDIDHPTPKKLSVVEKILLNISRPDDVVLDCFSGSGTTAVACHRLNRRFICIEKDPEYWRTSCARLDAEQKQMNLF